MGDQTTVGAGRPYRGLSPDERRADRRRRLIDAGFEMFGTIGYAGTSIEAICNRAGVTTRHFYEEFGSREELLKSVFAEVVALVSTAVVAALDTVPTRLEDRLRAGMGAFVHGMLDDPRRARIFCIEVVGVSPELEAHRRSVLHIFARVVQEQAEMLRVGEAPRLPEGRTYTLTTLALVGGANELIIEWMLGGQPVPVDELVDELVMLFLAVGKALLGVDGAAPAS